MRSDEQERPSAARRGRRGGVRRRGPQPPAGPPPAPPAPPEQLRAPEEIRAQHEAARAFAGEVTRMMPTSHQYTAGQAAALAWLLEQGPTPLTYDALAAEPPAIEPPAAGPAAEGPSPDEVRRLAERARRLMDGTERDELFPPAYVMGVDYVCEWVRGRTDVLPIPRPDGLRPA